MTDIPKLPIQFEKQLKDFKIAYLRYLELRGRPGANVNLLDGVWRKNQALLIPIEVALVNQFGKEITEVMLEQAIGWRTLPRI